MPKRIRSNRVACSILALAIAPLWVSQALAQESPAAAPAPEAPQQGDIIVTAQKREQNIQKIGASISAIGTEGLKSIGRQDITALTNLIPSVQANQYSPTLTVFNIRGVSQNDFSDSQEAPIAFYNDEVYVAPLGAISGQNFDLERVEVLRGPQGTLFGRNATGGLIQIVSAKPTPTLEGYATLTVGSYGQISTEGAISGPLTDNIRARLSFTSNNNNGYIRNLGGGNLGNSKFYGGRVQIAADIGSGGKLLLKGQLLRNDHEAGGPYSYIGASPGPFGLGQPIGPNDNPFGTCNGCDLDGYRKTSTDPFLANVDTRGNFDRTYYTGTARYTQSLGSVTLTSITDFQRLKKDYTEDSDATPISFFNYQTRQRSNQFSQEIRLNGDDGGIHWVFGGYYFSLDTRNGYHVSLPVFADQLDYFTRTRTRSEAVFGQLEYPITSTISLIGGARYSWEQKRLNYSIFDLGTSFANVTPENRPDIAKKQFNNYSGKVEVDFKPSNNVLLYASVNRGTKGGGFGTLGYVPPDLSRIPYGQEVLTSYEGGFKLTLLDRKMHFNGSVFHYDYDNYQAYSAIGLSQFITNNQARVNGVEFEVNGTLFRGLDYQLFGTYLDAKVLNLALPDGTIASSRNMPQAPRWSAGGMLRYGFQAFSGELALETDWKWNSSQYFSAFNAPIDRQEAYAVGNVRIEYKPRNMPFDVSFFVQNVTDKQYLVYSLDLSALGYANHVYGRPRWFGGTVTFHIK